VNATLPRLAALLCAALTASLAQAQYYYPTPYLPPGARYLAPDACGYGFYCVCPDGSITGPHYCVRPPFAPFGGVLPPLKGNVPSPLMAALAGKQAPMTPMAPMLAGAQGNPPPRAQVVFPTHPYARSPRDFFMWNEAQEERITRERRPPFAP